MKKFVALSFAVVLLSVPAFAESLAQKAAWKKAQTKIDEFAASANKQCGSTVKFEVDKDAFKGEDGPKKAADFMWSASEAVGHLCLNVEGAKDEVQKLKAVKMTKGAATKFEKSGSTIHYTTNLEGGTAGPRDAMVEWLKHNL